MSARRGLCSRCDSRGGDRLFMKNDRVAKPRRKPVASGRLRQKLRSAQTRKGGDLLEAKPSKSSSRPQSRSISMRLAAEVDALAAQLKVSRARINELEARVDIDPLTEIRN